MRQPSTLCILACATCLLFVPASCHANLWTKWSPRKYQDRASGILKPKFWKVGDKTKTDSGFGVPANHEFVILQRPREKFKPTSPVPRVEVLKGYSTPLGLASAFNSKDELSSSGVGTLSRPLSDTGSSKDGLGSKRLYKKGQASGKSSVSTQGSSTGNPSSPSFYGRGPISGQGSLQGRLRTEPRRYPPPTTPPPPPPVQSTVSPSLRHRKRPINHVYDEPISPLLRQKSGQGTSGYTEPYKSKGNSPPSSLQPSRGYESSDRMSKIPSSSGYGTVETFNRPLPAHLDTASRRNQPPRLTNEEIDQLHAKPNLAAKKNRRHRQS
ncbi:hypothetical protein GQ602_005381 [Ophiocordyceps camponoti-floridani]|uniref:Uncharacterized protein n=1 Tax=Ophiocordyceps camponoti-floridani TaxID=2030778 RepID=A0A8H4Q5N2_9HYPO|nr:hypothetical protein GQ602_005381 [Ophiocordyceps camponoti-floridani]